MSKYHDLQMFKLNKMHNFQTLEVVVRGSETQLQVPENLNKGQGLIQVQLPN